LIFTLSQTLNGLFKRIVIAPKILLILFCAAKAIAKPQIPAQATKALTSYHKFPKTVITHKIHIITSNTFSIKGNRVLASCCNFNFGFFITLYLKKCLIILVRMIKTISINNTFNTALILGFSFKKLVIDSIIIKKLNNI
jgi:hypothetical protein